MVCLRLAGRTLYDMSVENLSIQPGYASWLHKFSKTGTMGRTATYVHPEFNQRVPQNASFGCVYQSDTTWYNSQTGATQPTWIPPFSITIPKPY
jgi:hypothetical protein